MLKHLVKSLLPYGLVHFIRYLRRKRNLIVYEGDYPSWKEAEKYCLGYGTQEIIDKVFSATNAVIHGDAVYERDSGLHLTEDYDWPLLSSLYFIRLHDIKDLHVLNFGGSLGSTYWKNRNKFFVFSQVSWHIIEQESFFEASKKLCHTEPVTFDRKIQDVFAKYPINLVLFSSVLQYIENIQQIMDEIFQYAPDYIVIDRTPLFSEGTSSQILIESVPPSCYQATYALEIRQKDKFLDLFLSHNYEIVFQWDSNIDPALELKNKDGEKREVKFYGFLLTKNRKGKAIS